MQMGGMRKKNVEKVGIHFATQLTKSSIVSLTISLIRPPKRHFKTGLAHLKHCVFHKQGRKKLDYFGGR